MGMEPQGVAGAGPRSLPLWWSHGVNMNSSSRSRAALFFNNYFFFSDQAVFCLFLFTQRSRYLIRHLATSCLSQPLETKFYLCSESSSLHVNAPSDRSATTCADRRCCGYHISSCAQVFTTEFTLFYPLYGFRSKVVYWIFYFKYLIGKVSIFWEKNTRIELDNEWCYMR